jgi:hypothetical protein
VPRLSHSVSGAVRLFSFWLANRTVGLPLLEGVDYSSIFEEPSALEQTFAIFVNVLEVDESGTVLNTKHASTAPPSSFAATSTRATWSSPRSRIGKCTSTD